MLGWVVVVLLHVAFPPFVFAVAWHVGVVERDNGVKPELALLHGKLPCCLSSAVHVIEAFDDFV